MTSPGRAALLEHVSEAQFQAQVLRWLRRAGYRTFHVHDARKSASGFPDVVAVKSGKPVLYAELKSAHGHVSAAQRAWLEDLGRCPGTSVHLWRPTDEDRIKRMLRLEV